MDLIEEITKTIQSTKFDAGRGSATANLGLRKSAEIARDIGKVVAAWVREQPNVAFYTEQGDPFECYLMPTRILNKIEK